MGLEDIAIAITRSCLIILGYSIVVILGTHKSDTPVESMGKTYHVHANIAGYAFIVLAASLLLRVWICV